MKIEKSFFEHIFVKIGSIYVKSRPKWSTAHSTHIVKFYRWKYLFLWKRDVNMWQRPPGREPTCYELITMRLAQEMPVACSGAILSD